MKIQLNYDTKTIMLVNDVSLKKFYNIIKNLLPDWKEWNLSSQATINWINPITIPYYPNPIPYDTYITSSAVITLDGDSHTLTDGKVTNVTSGIYNLEVN